MRLNRVNRFARRISASERLVCSPLTLICPCPMRAATSRALRPVIGVSWMARGGFSTDCVVTGAPYRPYLRVDRELTIEALNCWFG
jgi:hypothetical protein